MKKWLIMLFAVLSAAMVIADELPDKFKVRCGSITVGVSRRSFWNLNGIWFNDIECCLADTAWYGTTTSYGKGWVGSGHLENGIGEKEVKVKFFLDGKEWIPAAGVTAGEIFEYEKSSLVGEMRLIYHVKVTSQALLETVKITMNRPQWMTIYHYMHPWNRIFTEYFFADRNGGRHVGTFATDKKHMDFLKAPRWFAGYSPRKNVGFVSVISSVSSVSTDEYFLLWNRLVDRKLYFVPVREKKVPAGRDFQWIMTTSFFETAPEKWQDEAILSSEKFLTSGK